MQLRIHPWRSPGRLGLLALALVVCAVLGAGASAARAAVPTLPPNTPFKLKFAHSGMVVNVPNASNKQGVPLVQYFDVNGFSNDNFTFIKVGGPAFGPNSYVIQAGKAASGLALYVMPHGVSAGDPIVQDRPAGPFAVWDLVPSHLAGYVHIVHRQTGLAMNIANASLSPGAPLVLFPPQNTFLNDDIKILPAT